MTSDKQNELYKKFPELFREKDLDQTKTCMCWGIECGDGWYKILHNMCESLQGRLQNSSARVREKFPGQDVICGWLDTLCRNIEKKLKIKYGTLYTYKHRYYERYPGYRLTFSQIKEKFGTLRVYYNFSDKYTKSEVEHLDQNDILQTEHRVIGYIDGVIGMAENMSAETCEKCGREGKLSGPGWIKCLCEECDRRS